MTTSPLRPRRPGRSAAALVAASALVALVAPPPSRAAPPALAEVLRPLAGLTPSLETLYADLHRHPELSLHEVETARKLAGRLRALGFEVTERVGGTGIVGVLRNGAGPTLLLRTELDALPVKEDTGLPFASIATGTDPSGASVPVMHACGHDLHMAVWVGTATLLAGARDRWRGTLVMMGQPAEEIVQGAGAMIADGLLTRFPRPDFAVALHDSSELPAGQVGWVAGPAYANVDTVDITIFGQGGHGAGPHRTVDPILIAARTVVTLQSIVSREVKPTDPAVVTVGSIHGGTKHNVIPDTVKLQLTVRSYKDEVQRHLLSAIERIARAEAAAGRAPREPEVKVDRSQSAPSVVNDPALTRRLAEALRPALGRENVVEAEPVMGSEDFAHLGRAGIPAVMLRLGAVEPAALARATAEGRTLPPVHSARFAPDLGRSLPTGVTALTAAALELLPAR